MCVVPLVAELESSLSFVICFFLALFGSLSGSLWLPLAPSGPHCNWLSIALQICLQSPCSAHKALARLVELLLRYSTLFSSGEHRYAVLKRLSHLAGVHLLAS